MATEVVQAAEPPSTPAEVDHAGATAEAELPKAGVQRLVRSKLVQILESLHKTGSDKKAPNAQINKDALLAFQESGKVFINCLASTANDYAKEAKRVTISAEDVFKALEELDFKEFVQPLRQFLEAHKASAKEKTAKKKDGASASKKRKASEVPADAEADKETADKEVDNKEAPAPEPPSSPKPADEQADEEMVEA